MFTKEKQTAINSKNFNDDTKKLADFFTLLMQIDQRLKKKGVDKDEK